MAHIFKWKAIYRIIKNQRSPQIEERGKAFVEEYAALLGSAVMCLSYLVKANVNMVIRAMTERTLVGMLRSMGTMFLNILRAYGKYFSQGILDSIVREINKIKGGVTAWPTDPNLPGGLPPYLPRSKDDE